MLLEQTVSAYIKAATKQLDDAAIPTARLDCLVLLEDELGKDRAWILAHPDHLVPAESLARLAEKMALRVNHVPIAYIRGKSEFYGRKFIVSNYTLVPRPETETMVELIKKLALEADTEFLDVGTGSGCIAISMALEVPNLRIHACDIDERCLEIARANARNLHANIDFIQSDLLSNIDSYDIIGTNLPYVPDDFHINVAASHEPRLALYGGSDGLDLYRKLFQQITDKSQRPIYILTESLPFQHETLVKIAKAAGFTLLETDDFIQVFTPA